MLIRYSANLFGGICATVCALVLILLTGVSLAAQLFSTFVRPVRQSNRFEIRIFGLTSIWYCCLSS